MHVMTRADYALHDACLEHGPARWPRGVDRLLVQVKIAGPRQQSDRVECLRCSA